MRFPLGFLPLLGCAALMIACIRMMGSNHKGTHVGEAASDVEIAEIREEIASLREQLALSAGEPARDGE